MNGDQWAGDRAERWLRQVDALERQLHPVLRPLFQAAAIVPGESVLDVGCGAGPATREAAAHAGADGRVTGLDVSAQMLRAAAERASDGAPIQWVTADAVSWDPVPGSYDVVISRFGVMFFSDPTTAVANLARATRVGGRFAAAVWGRRDQSPMFDLPYRVVAHTLARRGVERPAADSGRGPFSWHDEEAVDGLLRAAGWHDVLITPHTMRLEFAGGAAPADAARAAADFGSTRDLLYDVDADALAAAQDALAEAFADHLDDQGHVVLDAAVRIVTAVR